MADEKTKSEDVKKKKAPSRSMADWEQNARTLVRGVLADESIGKRMARVGYPEAKLREGLAMLDEVSALIREQKKQHGESVLATETFRQAVEGSYDAYMVAVKFARIVLGNRTDLRGAMMVDGPRNQSLSGRMVQLDAFYGNLLGDNVVIQAMAGVGYTKADLQASYDTVRRLDETYAAMRKESGESMAATRARDAKIDEVAHWVSDLRAKAKIVFAGEPDKLKALGITR